MKRKKGGTFAEAFKSCGVCWFGRQLIWYCDKTRFIYSADLIWSVLSDLVEFSACARAWALGNLRCCSTNREIPRRRMELVMSGRIHTHFQSTDKSKRRKHKNSQLICLIFSAPFYFISKLSCLTTTMYCTLLKFCYRLCKRRSWRK